MSSQPISMNRQALSDEQKKRQAMQERRSDVLYIVGGLLVAFGLGCIRYYLAPIALGCFCLIFPSLEIAKGFIRGLRSPVGGLRR